MELPGESPEDGGSSVTKETGQKQSHDLRQTLQVMLQRQAKFLENCREVKVSKNMFLVITGRAIVFNLGQGHGLHIILVRDVTFIKGKGRDITHGVKDYVFWVKLKEK